MAIGTTAASLGHSMDGDGEMYSARYIRVDSSANTIYGGARYTQDQ